MAATSTRFPTAPGSRLVSSNHLAYLNAASCSRVRLDLVKLSQLFEAESPSSKRWRKLAEGRKFRGEMRCRSDLSAREMDKESLINNEDRFLLRKFLLRSTSTHQTYLLSLMSRYARALKLLYFKIATLRCSKLKMPRTRF